MVKDSERKFTKSGDHMFSEVDADDIIKSCTDEKGQIDLRHALSLAYVLGRSDAEKDQRA